MQPRPRAETSRLLFPNLRFCMRAVDAKYRPQFILSVGGSQGWERRINGGAATSWPLTQNAAETRESSNTAASNLKQQLVFATILVQMTVAATPRLILRSRPYDPP